MNQYSHLKLRNDNLRLFPIPNFSNYSLDQSRKIWFEYILRDERIATVRTTILEM